MSPLIEEIFSEDGWYKAKISKRKDDKLQVSLHKWSFEIDDKSQLICSPFWSDITQMLSITDNIDTARKIAIENLRNASGCVKFTNEWHKP